MTQSRIVEVFPDFIGPHLSEFESIETRDALRQELKESIRLWAGFYENQLIVLFGIRAPNLLSNDVYVWMAATGLLEKHPRFFLRHCREGLRILDGYPRLKGLVLCDFEASKRWLRWLGFTVGEPNGAMCEFWR